MDQIGGLLSGFLTFFFMIAFWSLIVKETMLYRFAEHVYVGLAIGNSFVMSVLYLTGNTVPAVSKGNVTYIFPIVLGVLLFTALRRPISYMARWGSAIIMGAGTALAIQGQLGADLVQNVRATMVILPELTLRGINSILIPIMMLSAFTYFIFTITKPPFLGEGWLPKFGRVVLMATFGARYANGLMSRVGVAYPMLRDNVIYFVLKVLGLMPW
jgi:hypothetical protein